MPNPTPIKARVVGQGGKYVYLDKGKSEGVQVGDWFEDATDQPLFDSEDNELGDAPEIHCELQVERVFDKFSCAVIRYAETMPYFEPPYNQVVVRGPEFRITSAGNISGKL